MFAKSNKEARKVVDQLFDMKGRKLVPVDVTADSLYDSLLCQISRKKEKYKSYEFRKQIAYFLSKHPEWFAFMLDELNIEESYESFIMNLCQGLSMPNFKIVCAVVTKMWNVTIDIVTPKGVYKMYHEQKYGEAVLVWNGVKGIDSQFCGSKIDNPNWHPIKGLDWSGDVKNLQNVKAAAVNAEKGFRSRTANKIVNEYNEVTESILTMKETLVQMNSDVTNMEKELKSMKQKIDVFASNVYKMEGKQGVLRLRLIELGVTVDKFLEPGSIVQGFQEFQTPQEPPPKKARTATVSKPEDLGTPPDFSDMTPTISISAEVHKSATSTPSATVEQTTAGKPTPASTPSTSAEIQTTTGKPTPASTPSTSAEIQITKVVQEEVTVVKEYAGADVVAQRKELWSNPLPPQTAVPVSTPQTAVPVSTPQTAVPVSTPQTTALVSTPEMMITPTPQFITLPQTPSTFQTSMGEVSVRWGKTLKGVHKFWCFRCRRPFTTKNDCTRHEDENCPMLDKSERKKYICDICQAERSSKQYLREHMAEEHTKQFIYFCKGCNKGFYKHTALNHHKKSCLSYLVPGNPT